MNKSKIVRLCEYIDEQRDVPFKYGKDDCFTFVGGATMELEGKDPIKRWRGKYATALKARRLINDAGGSIADIALTVAKEISNGEASTGDWALLKNEDGTETLGVVVGWNIWAKAETGVCALPRERGERFFRP
jgi:hypothetical protein